MIPMGHQPHFPAEKLQVGAKLSISSVVTQTRGDAQPGLRSGLVSLQKAVSLTTGLAAFPRASSLEERLRTRASAHPSLAVTARGPLTLPCGLNSGGQRPSSLLSILKPPCPPLDRAGGYWTGSPAASQQGSSHHPIREKLIPSQNPDAASAAGTTSLEVRSRLRGPPWAQTLHLSSLTTAPRGPGAGHRADVTAWGHAVAKPGVTLPPTWRKLQSADPGHQLPTADRLA